MRKIFYSLILTAFSTVMFAQGSVSGTVNDGDSGEALIGASVSVKGTSLGTVTDLDGMFKIMDVPTGNQVVVISYVGFTTREIPVTVASGNNDLGSLGLSAGAYLSEIEVVADIAVDRRTPVAVSTLNQKQIEAKLGSRELPEVLNATPGVYATKSGGGYGDSRINIRGFDQRNVAVLINGIPVNDMENGWVYWSNWAGLGDAVRTVQVQRGLGASKLAINSVGGTMNIITKTTDAEKGGSFKTELSSYNTRKALLSLSTGKMDNGTAVTLVGSRTEGPGFIDGTYIDAWSYYVGISHELNKAHTLAFTLIGAPQKHGQRDNSEFSAQSYDSYDNYGTKYNPNWGYARGEFLNERNNYYHKPQAALNHYWTIDDANFLATSAYISTGTGGGSGILGRNPIRYGAPSNELGQRQWDTALEYNDTSSTGSYLIMRNSVNNHFWTGILSSLKSNLTNNLDLNVGIDGRHYVGEHYREVRDLLGGAYWGDAVTPEAQVGDRIAYENTGIVTYGGLFAQLEYTMDNISAFVGGTISNTWYGREDPYNHARGRGELEAEVQSMLGYNAKAGANYNINENHNVFVNAGYYSRAPFHNFVYVNFGNEVNPDLKNETILGLELGYGIEYDNFKLKANGYFTEWKDRWVRQGVVAADGNRYTSYFQVPSQPHMGIEIEARAKVYTGLEVGAVGSFGDYKYNGNFDVTIFDDDTREVISEAEVFADGLYVPDQPQTQYGILADWEIGDFTFGGDYIFYDNLYAKFEVAAINSAEDAVDSYKLPSYGMMNLNGSYDFNLAGLDTRFSVQAFNVTNVQTPVEGWGDDRDDFKGFWTWDRHFNFALKVNF